MSIMNSVFGINRKFFLRFRKPHRITITRLTEAKRFVGKNIVVVGGSSGIGLNIAESVIAEGGRVLITGRNEAPLKQATQKCGDACRYMVWDAADAKALQEKLAEVFVLMDNKLDGIVYSAGVHTNAHYDTCTEAQWDSTLASNLDGFSLICEGMADEYMSSTSHCCMILINSIRGILHDTTPYSLSKVASAALVETYAKVFEGRSIRVNAVAPGPTGGTKINQTDVTSDISTKAYRCGRLLLPQEICELTLFLLSDDARAVNGQIIACDCGESLF